MRNYGNLKPIDEGGQAKIYLGDDLDANNKVIFKVAKHDNRGSRRRLRREARQLREQDGNRHVVRLIEDCSDHHPPFLVLEYCSGGSLAEWVLNRRSVRDVVIAMIHAMNGLQPSHAKNGFHGDFTPRNLHVSNEPDGWLVKVLDFGLGQTPNYLSGSITRSFRGTPGYIAPEVLQGDDYTCRSDIWSAHVVFRELLTGMKTQSWMDFTPPPSELTALINRMGAETPDARPSTEIIIQELHAFLNKPVEVLRPIPFPQSTASGLGILVTALVLGGVAVLANKNQYDSQVGRYRNRNGQFASGWFG